MKWLKERSDTATRFERFLYSIEEREITVVMSEITLGEIYYSAQKEWGLEQSERTLSFFRTTQIEMVLATSTRIWNAARMKGAHRISYANAFLAALGREYDCAVLTGEPGFLMLARNGVPTVEWLGA